MENTLENKAKFFGQHIGQNVFRYAEHIEITYELVGGLLHPNYSKRGWLELRPLSSITDFEAIEVAKIFGYDLYSYQIVRSSTGIEINNTNDELFNIFWSGTIWYKVEYEIDVQSHCIDYLRSKGFLLPFHDLSIEQIIAYGWAKLKTEEL